VTIGKWQKRVRGAPLLLPRETAFSAKTLASDWFFALATAYSEKGRLLGSGRDVIK